MAPKRDINSTFEFIKKAMQLLHNVDVLIHNSLTTLSCVFPKKIRYTPNLNKYEQQLCDLFAGTARMQMKVVVSDSNTIE